MSKDFGAYASASSVSVASTEYGAIKLALDSTEMNADVVMVRVSSSDANVVPFTATIYTAATPRQALRYLRNKWSLDGSTLTVTKEDDSTPSWTAVVSTAATAEAITGIDPA